MEEEGAYLHVTHGVVAHLYTNRNVQLTKRLCEQIGKRQCGLAARLELDSELATYERDGVVGAHHQQLLFVLRHQVPCNVRIKSSKAI
jgi:hypothetical protein